MKNFYSSDSTDFTPSSPIPEENQQKPLPRKRKSTAFVVTIIICAVLAFFILIGGLVFGIMSIGRNHPSFVASVNYIETSSEIEEHVGNIENIRTSGFSISTSGGFGEAEHNIRVIGERGSAVVRIQLETVPGQCWEIINSEVFPLP